MTKTIALQLIVYGVLVAGLGCIVHHLAPTLSRPTLLAGLAGGAWCLVWGVRAVLGKTGKTLPVLTLVPVSFVMLSQAVTGWMGGNREVTGRRAAATVITLLLALSVAMLMRIAYAGVAFGVSAAQPANERRDQPPTAGKPAPPARAAKAL